ncbi:hypothetical protein POL68_24480 [Stigmatella sp. ncwal1]|uniref:Lipoprotein n=1 Tax=Stigmatella ashevillensis TaxID=2995309 RepID=A0ABT5DFT5_9BACT|nr:hypothetical protein [Stigmatella ashevillena]MDC0711648.1 hypothetical protein [Stigmatella ashevillena]
MMRRWIQLGCTVLGMGAMACGSQMARAPAPTGPEEAPPVAASSGGGGAATVDTGQFPSEGEAWEPSGEKRRFYGQVARELKLSLSKPTWLEEGMGGAGTVGGEKHLCVDALQDREPVTVVSGILTFTSNGLVTVDVPGRGPVKLLTANVTCSVQAGKAMAPESLSEGTEVRVAYVEGSREASAEPTARVIRAEPMRPTR